MLMNKILRYVLLSFLTIMSTATFATIKTVTFDFDNDYQTIFPTITGVSSSDSNAGDFPADGILSADMDGIVLAIAAAEDAKNPDRIWNSSPRLRMYSGYFILTATKGDYIKKVEFEAPKFNLTSVDGTLTEKVWTGNVLGALTFAVGGNTQIKKMVVTLGGENDSLEGGEQGGETAQEMSVADALAYTIALGADVESTEDVTVKGKICSIKYTYSANYGTATYNISDDGQTGEGKEFTVYGSYFFDNKPWEEGNTQIAVGDIVIVKGKVINYKGTTPEFANKKNYLISLNGKTNDENTTPTPDTPTEITVAKALEIAAALADNGYSDKEYLIKGFVVGTPAIDKKSDGTFYGNAKFYIADTKGGSETIYAYQIYGLNGENMESEDYLKENDEVIVQGKLQKYVKNDVVTLEIAKGGKITSLNGKTGITNIIVNQMKSAPVYNVAGQMVTSSYKGLVIKNGRKMIQK